jgi:triphosphoribosyl-dephospho-CoA synthase
MTGSALAAAAAATIDVPPTLSMRLMRPMGNVGKRGRSDAGPEHQFCRMIARFALRALHAELTLHPKPGLVSPVDNGSHHDMDAATFMRSLFSLRHYFIGITQAGAADAPFSTLKALGITAERRMLAATGGINTHRGAIFSLGLLCAAIGACRARQTPLSAQAIRCSLYTHWGAALALHAHDAPAAPDAPDASARSHGAQVAARYAQSGAREEAALGLPSVFTLALPALERALARGRDWDCARIDALFTLMAHMHDSNIAYRGGLAATALVREHAAHFLRMGGSAHPDWRRSALHCHRIFVSHRLSPGGAADLLAATCLLHQVTQHVDGGGNDA